VSPLSLVAERRPSVQFCPGGFSKCHNNCLIYVTRFAATCDNSRRFDAEDLRLMTSLCNFAAAAYQVLQALKATTKAHAELLQSESRYRTLFELGPVAVYSCETSGVIRDCNHTAVELWGRLPKPEDTDERFCGSLKMFRSDGTFMPHDQCPMAEVLAGKIPEARDAEVHFERPDGSCVTVLVNIRPLKNERGEITGAVNCFVDITGRKKTEEKLREIQAQVEAELADTKLLQAISAKMIQEENVPSLYDKIMEAAVNIMHSDYASMQMFYPERGLSGELRLLASRGFTPEAVDFWEWVSADSQSSCGMAMHTGQQCVVPDVEKCDFMAGTPDQATYRQSGIHAVQTTPLLSLSGKLQGMISTHWSTPHQPSERDLRLLAVLARQVADLLERKRAEEKLRESERKYRALFDSIDEGFCIIEKVEGAVGEPVDFRYLEANPAFALQSGISGMIGKTFGQIIPGEAVEWCKIYDTVLKTGEPIRFERYLNTYGRALELYAFRVEDETHRRVAVIFKDISARQRADEQLRASSERLRFMAESMPQKIFTAKPNGDVDYCNQQWLEFLGLTFEQIKDWGWTQFIHPEDVEENIRRWKNSIDTCDDFQLEHRWRRKDGVYRWHLSRAHAMLDDHGNVLMWIGSNTDVDDARRTLEELARSSLAKDDFLAALSHELRTPLAPVLLIAAALREDERLTPDVREQLGVIESNIALEARLIDDLLDLTKISHGKPLIRAELSDAHHLIDCAIEIVKADARAKSISIERRLTAQHPRLMVDPTRFQQVIWNLLRNAVKFTPQGGRVCISTCDVITAEGIMGLRIEVVDSGIGIAAARLEQIFRPFDQGDHTGDHRFGGLGLGLAIARAVVDSHGGRITAQSTGLNCGATFVVELFTVIKPASPFSVASNLRSSASTVAPLRVLLVEDDASTRLALAGLLQRDGHRVFTAASVAEALAATVADKFDLVISDLGLPDGSGSELMNNLRVTYGLRGIALSGYGMEEDLVRSRAAGFATHLVKPVAIAELRRVIAAFPTAEK
jgi:PAS domain S-box-containing protein